MSNDSLAIVLAIIGFTTSTLAYTQAPEAQRSGGAQSVQRSAITLRYQMGSAGKPYDVIVDKSSGYRERDRAAIMAAKMWLPQPKRKDLDATERKAGRAS